MSGIAIFILIAVALYTCATFSFAALGIAHRYNRDPDWWGIAGFVFGPIALAILYSTGKRTPSTLFPVTANEQRKWDALGRADKHVSLAAKKAREISESCERDLILMYFALNDRQELPNLLKTAIEAAEVRKKEAGLSEA